jgi:hypothetical protein
MCKFYTLLKYLGTVRNGSFRIHTSKSRSKVVCLQGKEKRAENGFAMAAITAISCLAGLWLLAAANTVYPAYQKAAEFRYWTNVRSAAEAGLDYTVAQLNLAMQAETTSPYDDPTTDTTPKVTVIPESVTGSHANVTVSVLNVAPDISSAVYDENLVADPSGMTPGRPTSNYWRVITSSAQYAGLSSQIRIVLRPTYTGGADSPGSSTTVPFFNYALFSQNAFVSSGNMHSDAYDSRNGAYGVSGNVSDYRGHIGTNTSANIAGNTIIGGKLEVRSPNMGSTTVVVASRSGNAKVNGQLQMNGIGSSFTYNTTPPSYPQYPGTNDTAKGINYNTSSGVLEGISPNPRVAAPVQSSLSMTQVSLAPAPSAPSGSYNVGAVSVSGNGKVIVRNNVPAPSSINVSSNNTIYIPPGNYKASSMNISGNGQIIIEPTVTQNITWTFEGNSAGSNVITIAGNGIANQTSTPAKFQMYTNSSKNISISGNGNTHAVIYAPSANITIAGNGNLFGAAVGKGVTVSGNGFVHFDLALADANYAATNGLGYLQSTTPALDITGMQTVSWEEL